MLRRFREVAWTTCRSSHRRCSVKKRVLWNFAKFTGKHLCHLCSLRPVTLLKKRPWYRCFYVNLAKFLRTLLQNTSGRPLLYLVFNENQHSAVLLLYLREKKTSWVYLEGSGLKLTFHWCAHLLKSNSHLPKKTCLFASMKALWRWWKMLFISSSFSRYLNFCLDFLVM